MSSTILFYNCFCYALATSDLHDIFVKYIQMPLNKTPAKAYDDYWTEKDGFICYHYVQDGF